MSFLEKVQGNFWRNIPQKYSQKIVNICVGIIEAFKQASSSSDASYDLPSEILNDES